MSSAVADFEQRVRWEKGARVEQWELVELTGEGKQILTGRQPQSRYVPTRIIDSVISVPGRIL